MAIKLGWGGFVTTDLKFSEFVGNDHTIACRFLPQYPNAYAGAILSRAGSPFYFIGHGRSFISEVVAWNRLDAIRARMDHARRRIFARLIAGRGGQRSQRSRRLCSRSKRRGVSQDFS